MKFSNNEKLPASNLFYRVFGYCQFILSRYETLISDEIRRNSITSYDLKTYSSYYSRYIDSSNYIILIN